MSLGKVTSSEELNEEEYNIPEKDLLLEVSNGYLDGLDKGSYERREGPKLMVVEQDIFRHHERVISRIMTCNNPGDANVYEMGEELKVDLGLKIEGASVNSSKLVFLTGEYYKLDEKIFGALKKEEGRKTKS